MHKRLGEVCEEIVSEERTIIGWKGLIDKENYDLSSRNKYHIINMIKLLKFEFNLDSDTSRASSHANKKW